MRNWSFLYNSNFREMGESNAFSFRREKNVVLVPKRPAASIFGKAAAVTVNWGI